MAAVAILSGVNPYPKDAGKKVVLAGLLDYFTARLGIESVHYLLIGGTQDCQFPAQLWPVPAPTGRQAVTNAIASTVIRSSSLQEAFLWSRQTHSAVRCRLEDIDPAIEVYDTVRTAQYADDASGPTRICYLDDLFSERYTSMLAALEADNGTSFKPLGNFARHVPAALHGLTELPLAQKALLTREAKLVACSENRVARLFDRCLLVNENERRLLQHRAAVPPERIATLPPLIASTGAVSRDYRGAPEFLFLGLLSLPHNDDGLRSFIRTTWPLVLRRTPEAKLRIVGRDPQPELHAVIAKHGGGAISLEGYVPDLGALMARSAAMLSPLRFGSGIKLKIIEALSKGLPVVSSATGVSGIKGGVENGVCQAESPEEWVDQLDLLTDPSHNATVSAAAVAHFARVYSRTAVFAAYDSLFRL